MLSPECSGRYPNSSGCVLASYRVLVLRVAFGHSAIMSPTRPKIARKNPKRPRIGKRRLEEMIEEATVDCYNESEQLMGWLTAIGDNLAVPFETTVLGVPVVVDRV